MYIPINTNVQARTKYLALWLCSNVALVTPQAFGVQQFLLTVHRSMKMERETQPNLSANLSRVAEFQGDDAQLIRLDNAFVWSSLLIVHTYQGLEGRCYD